LNTDLFFIIFIFYRRADTGGEKSKSRTIANQYANKKADEFINVVLSETPTQSLFFLPSLVKVFYLYM
jgi:hypothetical protein